MTRRFGTPPPRARRHRLRPGVYAVIRLGGGVLLTVQASGDGAPELQLPGGGVDPGEQPLAALHREVREETGWRIGRVRRVGAYRRFDAVRASAFGPGTDARPGPGAALGLERIWARTRLTDADPAGGGDVWAEKVCTVYAARAVRRLGPPSEAGHAALVLTPRDAARSLTDAGQSALLARALDGA